MLTSTLACGCSVVKVALLAVVFVYLIAGLVAPLGRRETPAETSADS